MASNNQISFGDMMQSTSALPGSSNFNISKDGSAYDLGEFDQALFLYLDGQDQSTQEHKQNSGMRPPTLNIFPSEPMHVEPSSTTSKESTELVSNSATSGNDAKAVKLDGNRKGPTSSSYQEGPKTPDPKGFHLGGNSHLAGDQGHPVAIGNTSSDTTVFDMEYAHWLEEHHRLMVELRNAVHEHLPENELRVMVDHCLAHYNQVMNLKSMIAKFDVFHLFSGMWKTPAERCFIWMGDFRPSELIKIIISEIEPLTEHQLMEISGLQQSTQKVEETLSQGLEALNHSLSETITSDSLIIPPNMNNYMGQMALAINQLSTLEVFVRQVHKLIEFLGENCTFDTEFYVNFYRNIILPARNVIG
ncbi:hypothetical protein RD792_008023 [Penstemon davidsonii]|uniref:DOG1 domain-containing protein n=1 Tax=Penstemon davidsonii TaxID=160366 RepID=A0ABR0D8Q3_9LAMI|nr:hypothetical protein RD792_008023 [Penstemon davidsonii]